MRSLVKGEISKISSTNPVTKKKGAHIKIGQKKLFGSNWNNPNTFKIKIEIYSPKNIPKPPNLTMLDLCCFLCSGLSTILYFTLKYLITGTRATVEKKANINPLKLLAAWFKILSKKF